ncbi:MAG: Dam family site-specific DNA-(adenine-N6)-methyltransferase [Gammaproteobacteria bacterium]|nr:Dam family site-specific DNA-(adenine-N6)-methyltransferase [Gammaproteobacteria bacterium]
MGAATTRPPLKWAGGKYRLLNRIRQHLPTGNRLVEPFVGSGALFLNTDYTHYLLADNNLDLINLYQQIQQQGTVFINRCKRLFTIKNNTAEYYYRRRDEFNRCNDPPRKALLFLYLNRHGYNGLCRYNSQGGFNVPFGRYRQPYFPATELQHFYTKAQRAEFVHADFEWVMRHTQRGDIVYCDPPYAPLSRTANFTSYSSDKFGVSEQQRLADLAHDSQQRGIPVLVSNHDTEFTRHAYQYATQVEQFSVRRSISCNINNRERADELLALYL